MTKSSTNLLGIFITILAGTYFYNTYCSECAVDTKKAGVTTSTVSNNLPGVPDSRQDKLGPACNGLRRLSHPTTYPLPSPSLMAMEPIGSELFTNETRPWEGMDHVVWADVPQYAE